MTEHRKTPRALLAATLAIAAVSAAAAQTLQDGVRPLRVGIVSQTGEASDTLRQDLVDALGVEVEFISLKAYPDLVTAQMAGRVDYSVLSAVAFAAANRHCECLRPLASPISSEGSVGLRSVLIVRQGTVEPQRIAMGPADSLTMRLAPIAFWPHLERAEQEGRLVEALSASDAEALFLDGDVDGLFGWVSALESQVVVPSGGTLARLAEAGLQPEAFTVAWTSPILRNGPHVVRNDMPEDRARNLANALRRHGAGAQFRIVTQDDYAPILQMLDALDFND